MKSKIEKLEYSKNKINSFYLKCNNCKKIIPTLLGYLTTKDDLEGFCNCENPEPDNIIYIDKIK